MNDLRKWIAEFIGQSSRRGASLIDLLVALGILALIFSAVYLVYFSIVNSANSVDARTDAASVLNQQVEIIRNLSYDNVGTVGGIPAGAIQPSQTIIFGSKVFQVQTTIRNIDDPFDGTLGGTPNDTSPADYKLVSLQVSCTSCDKFSPLSFTTTVAPKNLESASSSGSLFVNVFDSAGQPVVGATVLVTNASVIPAIDLSDVTNDSGVLELVGVPSSTQSYDVQVSKNGYSSDRTYPPNGAGNPNPVKPDSTVAVQAVTNVSFAIDKTSSLNVLTSDLQCNAVANRGFSIAGAKTIGASLLKFSTTSATDASGLKQFSALEWDAYTLALTGSAYDVLGTNPLSPYIVNPNTSTTFRFALAPSAPDALLVSVSDANTGAGISNATVSLAGGGGFSTTTITGHAYLVHTDWSGGKYSGIDPSLDADSKPGALTLLANASGTYPTPAEYALVSQTFDLGGASSTAYVLDWDASMPPLTGSSSVMFQVAANNDNATWSFVGSDGTPATYFTASGTALPAVLSGKRFLRYKAYLSTLNENVTPELDDVTLEWNGPCVPPYSAYFGGLSAGSYTVSVNATGYQYATSSVSVGGAWQTAAMSLSQ